jgi:hypothetical protein
VAIQLVFGRKHFWLPRFMLDRHVTRGRLRASTRLVASRRDSSTGCSSLG